MKQLIITAEDMSATNSAGETRRRGNRITRVPEILEISINAFATDGYAAFNQRRVAREAGLRLSTLQHYFRTREDLPRATVEAMGDRYLDLYRKLSRDSSLTPLARLDKIADETFSTTAVDMSEARHHVVGNGTAGLDTDVGAAQCGMQNFGAEILREHSA
jgi:AcrR family transcriptional regulator